MEFFLRAARNSIALVKGILCDLLRDVIDANSTGDEEGEDAQVGDDREGDARFVDENGRSADHHVGKQAIKKLAKGGASGPSGWAPDHWRAFLDDDDLLTLYGEALTSITNKYEWMSVKLAQLFLGAR